MSFGGGISAEQFARDPKLQDLVRKAVDESRRFQQPKQFDPPIDKLENVSMLYPDNSKDQTATQELMRYVYQVMGYNGKPTVYSPEQWVEEVFGLDRQIDDVFLSTSGNVFILGRIVNTERNADSFEQDNAHYVPPRGWFGTGTYFAPIKRNRSKNPDEFAIRDAQTFFEFYAPTFGNRLGFYRGANESEAEWLAEAQKRKGAVSVAALRRNIRTNLQDIMGRTENDMAENFVQWANGVNRTFQQRFGIPAPDLGVAAAMLGYDAYIVPEGMPKALQGGEMVVLNRSKVIVTTPFRQKDLGPNTSPGIYIPAMSQALGRMADVNRRVHEENVTGKRKRKR